MNNTKRKITEKKFLLQKTAEGYPLSAANYVAEVYDDGVVIREERSSFGPLLTWEILSEMLRSAMIESLPSQVGIPLFEKLADLEKSKE